MALSTTVNLLDVTPKYLKDNYLIGLTLYGADGYELTDLVYQMHLDQAVAKLEDLTNVDVTKHVYTSEHHDYRVNDYVAYGFLQLFHLPVLSVEAVRAVYPTGQTIQVFPTEWVRLEKAHAQIHLVPTSGTLSQVIIGQGADYLPLIYSGLGYLPQLWEIDYTAGFESSQVPHMVVEALCKLACIEILQKMSDTVVPLGVQSQSVSVDGLSQSKGYALPVFKARIDAYKMDLGLAGASGLLPQLRQNYLGINLTSI